MSTTTPLAEPPGFRKMLNAGHCENWYGAAGSSGLRFDDSGLRRLAEVHGYIRGLHDAGKVEWAWKIYAELEELWRYLSAPDEVLNVVWPDGRETGVHIPRRIVEVSDDGTRHGFGFCAYARREGLEGKYFPDTRYQMPYSKAWSYDFMYNGAAIFREDGRWSTHT